MSIRLKRAPSAVHGVVPNQNCAAQVRGRLHPQLLERARLHRLAHSVRFHRAVQAVQLVRGRTCRRVVGLVAGLLRQTSQAIMAIGLAQFDDSVGGTALQLLRAGF